MGVDLITRPGPAPAPLTYELGATEDFQVRTAYATFDGTNASGDFLPCLTFYSQTGTILNRVFPDTLVKAGDVANVSYAPFQRRLIAHTALATIEQIGGLTVGTYDGIQTTTIPIPAGVQTGDLLLMLAAEFVPFTTPSTFTPLIQDHFLGIGMSYYFKFYTVGDATTYSLTNRGGNIAAQVYMIALRNVSQSDPVAAASNLDWPSGGQVLGPAVTTPVANCYLATAYFMDSLSFPSFITSPQTPFVNATVPTNGTSAQQITGWIDDLVVPATPIPGVTAIAVAPAGLQPQYVWGPSVAPPGSAQYITFTIALNPA